MNNEIKNIIKEWFKSNIGLGEEIVINEKGKQVITYLNNFSVINNEIKLFTDSRIFKYAIKEINYTMNYIKIITKDNKQIKIEMF